LEHFLEILMAKLMVKNATGFWPDSVRILSGFWPDSDRI
jgi:hypothetical protein